MRVREALRRLSESRYRWIDVEVEGLFWSFVDDRRMRLAEGFEDDRLLWINPSMTRRAREVYPGLGGSELELIGQARFAGTLAEVEGRAELVEVDRAYLEDFQEREFAVEFGFPKPAPTEFSELAIEAGTRLTGQVVYERPGRCRFEIRCGEGARVFELTNQDAISTALAGLAPYDDGPRLRTAASLEVESFEDSGSRPRLRARWLRCVFSGHALLLTPKRLLNDE